MNKKDRIHDWRKLKWPFTATFLYYSLLSLYTGTAEQSEQGFLVMFLTVLIVDAVAYFSYCYFLCKKEENMQKLWFVFILAYVLISTQQLSILWQMMTAHVIGAEAYFSSKYRLFERPFHWERTFSYILSSVTFACHCLKI